MKKQKIFLILCLIIFLCSFTYTARELVETIVPYQITINNCELQLDKEIVTINDSTYVPLRDMAEKLGKEVLWDENTKKINISSENILTPFMMNNLWGFLNHENEVVIEPKYIWVENFNEGLALVSKSPSMDPQFGYIDEYGNEVIECIYTSAGTFHNGYALVSTSNRFQTDGDYSCYFINQQGNNVFGKEYKSAKAFSESFAEVMIEGEIYPTPIPFPEQQKWVYIDTSGNIVSPEKYEETTEFNNGYAVVKKNDVWMIINTSFDYVSQTEFNSLTDATKYMNENF